MPSVFNTAMYGELDEVEELLGGESLAEGKLGDEAPIIRMALQNVCRHVVYLEKKLKDRLKNNNCQIQPIEPKIDGIAVNSNEIEQLLNEIEKQINTSVSIHFGRRDGQLSVVAEIRRRFRQLVAEKST